MPTTPEQNFLSRVSAHLLVSTHPPFLMILGEVLSKFKWFLRVSAHPQSLACELQTPMGAYSGQNSTVQWRQTNPPEGGINDVVHATEFGVDLEAEIGQGGPVSPLLNGLGHHTLRLEPDQVVANALHLSCTGDTTHSFSDQLPNTPSHEMT